jgi:hypothetical protein
MKEVLKEYVLYQDLVRLNNDEYYQASFTTPDIQDVFASIKCQEDYQDDRSCLFFLFNLKICA